MKIQSAIVFGAGTFGSAVARTLFEEDIEVMVVDKSEDLIQSLSMDITTGIVADITEDGVLDELGLSNFDVAIISIGSNLEASMIATVESKDQGVPMIYAKSTNDMQTRILTRLGVDKIIYPEQDSAVRLGRTISGGNVIEYIHFSTDHSIAEIPPLSKWIGKTIQEIGVRQNYNLNVIAIRKVEQTVISPLPDVVIEDGDMIVVVGKDDDIEKLI